MSTGRKPDYILGGLLKGDSRENSRTASNLGAGWLNESGSIYIKLNPFVVIDGNHDDVVLTLFPNDRV